MKFFKKKENASITTNPEIEKLTTEIKTETTYLAKLINKYYNDPKNDWKFDRLKHPYIYLNGKIERIRDDNEYNQHGARSHSDNRHFLKDPTLAEIQETERRIKNLQLKIRSVSLFDLSKDEKNIDFKLIDMINKQSHPINCDCDECYGDDSNC